jgi:hypothetical protein
MSQIRKKNIMDNALQQNMIDVARHYYTPLEMALSEDVLQDIVGITGLMNAPPVGGEVRGHARTISLQRVLASPNVYPVGEGSHQVRAFCQIYDSEKATVMINGNEVTNGMIRELAIRKFFVVHDIQISDAVSKSTLASGKHMKRNNDNMIVACACLAITRSVFGEQRACSSLQSLMRLGQYPENQLAYYMMVLPLVVMFCTELNPHMSLDPRTILRKDMSRLEGYLKDKLKEKGAWSEARAHYRLQLPPPHEESISGLDEQMLSGIEVRYLRWFTCFSPGWSLPWDSKLRMTNNLWISPEEKALLYVGYDEEWLFARFGRPRGRGPNSYRI